jgi:hypothetical protein
MSGSAPSVSVVRNARTLLYLILIAAVLFFGSILFILSRAPHS